MSKYKVYVSDFDYPDIEIEKAILEPIGAEVIGLQCKTGESLAEQAKDADAIFQQYAKISRETIEQLPKCKVIARYGIGVDIVDVEAAYENGMIVTNVPDYCIDEVANHSISMAFTLIRSIPAFDKATHNGNWHWSDWLAPIHRMREMTFGLVGFGRIAQNMARKLAAFGFDIIAYDPYVSEGLMNSHNVKKVDLDTLLRTSHVVDVMCPHTPETHHLINEEALKKMRKDSILINCARGKLVDNKALFQALSKGWIVAAGLDDTEEEPAKVENWSPKDNPLFTLDNCIITPHVAYISQPALNECRRIAAENIKAVLLGERPPNLVKPKIITQEKGKVTNNG
ncbi:C-terminal binding protein [Planomicrobium sp. CPCC 101079]|uniref:C-terminal binding protein n=1 Tax=Planomicrobium sp. CPCC 101079 TaxID=2599618 RepID=UPI0011B729EE|nr:C-terminal binding protein [Planomicrobium sp. CPCC 101079]TWT01767.1 C-terminal binding protein [Planomicrobium sp. CPCC 101079]